MPIKPLERKLQFDAAGQMVYMDERWFAIQPADLSDVIDLLAHPEGNPPFPIHRRFAPLAGYEQTAKALRLLLAEQLSN